ncbi:MAG: lysylphosphatidylglycerol synthase transmembrane domain-containing protein [Pseudomonadota bacterium]
MTAKGIKIAATLGLLVALVWWADAGAVWNRMRTVDLGWVAIAIAAISMATLLMARRWQHVARRCGIDMSYPIALGEYYVAQMGNAVLPGGVAGDVARAVRVRRLGSLKQAVKSIIVERLLGQIAMLTLMGVSFAVALAVPGGLAWPAWSWAGVIGLAAAGAALIWFQRGPVSVGRFSAFVFGLCRQPVVVLLSLLIAGCLLLAFYASARATGTLIPPAAWTTLIPLILCAMLVPLSVGGWGWREGAAAALFPLIGASADAGIATGIVYGSVILVATLPAGLFLLGTYGLADRFDPRTRARHDTAHSSDSPFFPSDRSIGVRHSGDGPARACGQSSTG